MVDAFPIWPRTRSTAAALGILILFQVVVFFAATANSFFIHEDFHHFALAHERQFLHYLATPIIHTYPAPGERLLFFLLYELFPLNYFAARTLLIGLLAGTTVLLTHLVRTLARSDDWWTVAIATPFAFSLTLVSPINLWSNGVPVITALFFTVIALTAWIRSYGVSHRRFWIAVTVMSIAAAGTFYMKFLLIPIYLLFLRAVIFPPLLGLPSGIWHLLRERARWIAVAVPPALFLVVYIFSGLAARSMVPGERPYLQYLATAWFGAVVPVSFLNIPLNGSTTPSAAFWSAIVCSQIVFLAVVGATVSRSSLALRAWAFFLVVFATNVIVVGSARLPQFGIDIAYWLRYYPEVVLFLPVVLALCLRQGGERRPGLAWENTTAGRTAIGLLACVHAFFFAFWTPRIVSNAEGVKAKVWFDNFRRDIDTVGGREPVLRIVDSETPEYIVLSWMAPRNRISVVLALLQIDAVYNQLSERTYVVQPDGRIANATFTPMQQVWPPAEIGERVWTAASDGPAAPREQCVNGHHLELDLSGREITGERLALRAFYAARSRQPVALEVDTDDPDRQFRHLQLRPHQSDAELVDLSTSRLRGLKMQIASADILCIRRMEIGSLHP